ncbi:hypothetical protein KFL_000290450 [Klebsormidium nitens]|uniref:CAAX prenyl protease 2/Lysostaphin resistance protein A-like domain-containing protein n=1 Tax=Klebsormidium nitens TaxID=105231 RepID=A0A1Y1HLA9_KLENI|nr:hypothetical protein KFL_000290450 [Klebsormidium nitens]|eukprot:GAQ79395.1 hypothetical protein KFL_000290450 [Klebsormidium nitens]
MGGRPTIEAAAQRRRQGKRTADNAGTIASTPPSPELLQPSPSPTTPPNETPLEPEPEAPPIPSREQVLKACTVTSLGIGAAGLGLRTAFHVAATAGLPVNDCSGLLPVAFDLQDILPTVAIIGGVSAVRWLLLATWKEFRESSEASNRQLLTSLELPDVFLLGLLPGLSEELLFRGFLVPAVSPDWKGAVVAGAVFGVLHISGGRNVAFGAWASAVGVVYGLGALSTQNLAVPVVAHILNNIVAGIAWKLRHARPSP